MAHELSFQNGQAEAIYSGDRSSVWHRLGNYVGARAITVEEVRKVIDVPVLVQPVTYQVPTPTGDSFPRESKKAFLTVRQDTGEELAMVGPDFTVEPYSRALVDNVLPIVEAGYASFDVAGLLRQGQAGWTLLKWNLEKMDGTIRDVYRDEIRAYGLCICWMGGGNANSYANVDIRSVCWNTIQAGMDSASGIMRVIHRSGIRERQREAAERSFQHVIAHHKQMAEAYRLLQSTALTRAQWKAVVADVAVINPETLPTWKKDAPRAGLVIDRYKAKVARLFKLWHEGTGHSGNASAWEAYNGVVESLDHDTDLWKVRDAESRALKLTDGEFARTRSAVFQSLMDHCNGPDALALTA